jgi:hypothetical protein
MRIEDIDSLPDGMLKDQIRAKTKSKPKSSTRNDFEPTDKPLIMIGIDPGTQTGLSVYDTNKQELIAVKSGTIIEMYYELLEWIESYDHKVRIEDARKRKWFGSNSKAKMQGAGSIKRDCKIWEEICDHHEINYEMVHPIKGATKLDAKTFKKMTGWDKQTNEHKRDSAMLVYGL